MASTTKSGDDILLLSGDREIASDNLWAIRAIPTLLVFGMVVVQVMDPYSGGPVASLLLGAAIIFLPLYALALLLFSSPVDDDTNPNDTA